MTITEIILSQTQSVIALLALVALYRQTMQIQKQATAAQLLQTYLALKEKYRDGLKEIVRFPGDYKELTNQTYSSVKDEDVRASVFAVLDIMNDVLHYHRESGLNWEGTAWEANLDYIFSKRLFATAFYDKQEQQKIFDEANHLVIATIIEKTKKKRKDKIKREKALKEAKDTRSAIEDELKTLSNLQQVNTAGLKREIHLTRN